MPANMRQFSWANDGLRLHKWCASYDLFNFWYTMWPLAMCLLFGTHPFLLVICAWWWGWSLPTIKHSLGTLPEVNISTYPGTAVPGLSFFCRAEIFKFRRFVQNIQLRVLCAVISVSDGRQVPLWITRSCAAKFLDLTKPNLVTEVVSKVTRKKVKQCSI